MVGLILPGRTASIPEEKGDHPAAGQEYKPDSASSIHMIDYEPIPLTRLIGTSDLILVGHVEKIREASFTFSIEDPLFGEYEEREIEVVKFVPTIFDGPRTAPYEAAQSFMLFLIREGPEDARQPWRIMGIGGEGEMPIDSGYVYFHARFVPGLERRDYRVHDVERMIQRYDAEAFEEAVRSYRDCFVWQPGAEKGRPEPKLVCTKCILDKYRSQSSIHDYLAGETLERIPR